MKFFFEGSLSPKNFNFFVKHNHRKPFPNWATDIKIRYFFLLLLYSDATKYAVLMTKVQISNIPMTKEDQEMPRSLSFMDRIARKNSSRTVITS